MCSANLLQGCQYYEWTECCCVLYANPAPPPPAPPATPPCVMAVIPRTGMDSWYQNGQATDGDCSWMCHTNPQNSASCTGYTFDTTACTLFNCAPPPPPAPLSPLLSSCRAGELPSRLWLFLRVMQVVMHKSHEKKPQSHERKCHDELTGAGDACVSTATILACPRRRAQSTGVSRFMSRASLRAPRSSSIWQVATWPLADA